MSIERVIHPISQQRATIAKFRTKLALILKNISSVMLHKVILTALLTQSL